MKLMVPNCERHHVFCLLSTNNIAFCCKGIVFCLIPFLFLEMQVTGVKNSRYKSGSVYNPPPLHPSSLYKPTRKCLWLSISLGFIFGVLRYSCFTQPLTLFSYIFLWKVSSLLNSHIFFNEINMVDLEYMKK